MFGLSHHENALALGVLVIAAYVGLFLHSNAAAKNRAHYRRIIAGTVGGLAVLEVLAGLYRFPILVEFFLQGRSASSRCLPRIQRVSRTERQSRSRATSFSASPA